MTEFLQEWRAARRAASAAEKSILRKTLGGEAAASVELDEMHRLRGIANDLFAVAMAEVETARLRLKR
jgi:hypothetical protein